MKNDFDKLILGCLIGGLLSGAGFYLIGANKKEKQIFLKRIGKIIAEVGEFLKKSGIEEKNIRFEELIKNIPQKGRFGDIAMLAALGMTLWKQWR